MNTPESHQSRLDRIAHPVASWLCEVETINPVARIVVASAVSIDGNPSERVLEFPLDSFPAGEAPQRGRSFIYTEFEPSAEGDRMYSVHVKPPAPSFMTTVFP